MILYKVHECDVPLGEVSKSNRKPFGVSFRRHKSITLEA